MRQVGHRLRLALAVVISAIGCTQSSDGSSTNSTTPFAAVLSSATAADLAFCLQDINRYRSQVNRPPLARSSALETFAAQGAQIDATAGAGHRHFSSTNGGGVAFGENELLRADPRLFATASVQDAIRGANAMFWAEGPGGGHYGHLASATYTQVGCGVYIAGGGVTVVEDFR